MINLILYAPIWQDEKGKEYLFADDLNLDKSDVFNRVEEIKAFRIKNNLTFKRNTVLEISEVSNNIDDLK